MLLYNGEFIPEDELRLPLTNRAFQFNDGLFETIIVADGKLRFWDDHVARMLAAAKALKLELPQAILSGELAEKLLQLAVQNNATTYGRLKLKLWRSGSGLYTPETNQADWLATKVPATPAQTTTLHIGICQTITTNYNPFSFFKGPNALLYVMAGIEKNEKGFDDMLLINRQHIVSELISSNIFWSKNDVLFTPAIDTGCVQGIVRQNILRWCHSAGIKTKEVYFDVDSLLKADAVFAGNVTGIRSIATIDNGEVTVDENFVQQVRSNLFA
ncbi:aminotransferase class IV [Pontibacter sp. KCTC 32443]|uniref:aminotransferase class IV n=1 Tax=Pontibacter TaxID=323449 RepID=UPI00164D3148|nr:MULTISPECIES: aminotransferase class IV [Pontibacter]MBC5773432.1 aminotransferase class IV [Pontibacter sp. KCTC 32443]